MDTASPLTRPFRVHARHLDSHHGRVVTEPSFEAAAMAYVEDLAPATGAPLAVIVHDLGSGHEHCFRIDLDSGDVSPCG